MSAYTGLSMVLIVLAIIVAVLWIFLPFAVNSIKNKMDTANEELVKIRKLLSENRSQFNRD